MNAADVTADLDALADRLLAESIAHNTDQTVPGQRPCGCDGPDDPIGDYRCQYHLGMADGMKAITERLEDVPARWVVPPAGQSISVRHQSIYRLRPDDKEESSPPLI